MNNTDELSIERRHVVAFLKLLEGYANKHLIEAEGAAKPCRIHFVDSDLMSVYVNRKTRDPINDWSSLLSLEPSNRRRTADQFTQELANVTGQAVVRFLFGSFLQRLEFQRQRLYITPEHEREFRSIVHSILSSGASERNWMNALKSAYIDLAKSEEAPELALQAARDIVDVLEKEANNADLAYTLLNRAISSLSTNLIGTPPPSRGTVLFSSDDSDYCLLVDESREPVWQAFIAGSNLHDKALLELIWYAFQLHDIESAGQSRSFAYFKSRLDSLIDSADSLAGLRGRRDLSNLYGIAVRIAADLSALTRINALGHWLAQLRPPAGPHRWEMVLISGSAMFRRTLKNWPEGLARCTVDLVHPLSLLRHVELWDPAGVRRLGAASYLDQPHEFALSRIFGGLPDSESPAEVMPFLESLKQQLEVVVAREAFVGDRGLRQLRDSLKSMGLDRAAFGEAVRNLVTQRFAQTYDHLVDLFPGERSMLPASSLPSLDLQTSPAAMNFILAVRHGLERTDSASVKFTGLALSLQEDHTGYNTLLALAIGYMARGHRWIPAAQTMVATATLLARGRKDRTQYPEGNEAIYLEAFLLRMSVGAEDDWADFSKRHKGMIEEALSTLQQWRREQRAIAMQPLGRHDKAPARADWVEFRYRLEDNAREVYNLLLGRLGRGRPDRVDIDALALRAWRSLDLHVEGAGLAESHTHWEEVYLASVWFNGIQAGLCVLQSWLLWHEATAGAATQGQKHDIAKFEKLIANKVGLLFQHREHLGKLLPVLARIFAHRTGLAAEWDDGNPRRTSASLAGVRFSAIDAVRIDWLRGFLSDRGNEAIAR